jgi:serine/threonine protein kinase
MATSGDSIGPWTLHEKLGVGGNATVWRASHKDGEVVTLKLINTTKAQHEPYRRFIQEVQFLQKLGDFPGVLPLLDAHLPERPKLVI